MSIFSPLITGRPETAARMYAVESLRLAGIIAFIAMMGLIAWALG